MLTADYDSSGVWVYQAYKPSIGLSAAARGSFRDISDFSTDRMTWIKFSLGWMMYRCDYARSRNQEVVLRIKLSHEAIDTILRSAVGSSWGATEGIYSSEAKWKSALESSEARWQWDPERDARLKVAPKNQRALQLGLRRSIAERFAHDPTWILEVHDVTPLVHEVRTCIEEGRPLPSLPVEREMVIADEEVRRTLGIN